MWEEDYQPQYAKKKKKKERKGVYGNFVFKTQHLARFQPEINSMMGNKKDY